MDRHSTYMASSVRSSLLLLSMFLFCAGGGAVMSEEWEPESDSKPINDTDALTIFRSRVDAHGNLAANWTTSDACSGRWMGVGCSGGRVTWLSLPSLDLRGPLDSLSHLDQLRLLDLHDNRLNGTLLPLLSASLPNLKLLYLSRNDLSGQIPPAGLGLLVRLLRIDLSDNNLDGPIPSADALSNLTRLLTLRLENNLLSGLLPDLSVGLPRLIHFNASNNQLSGRVPDGMLAKFGGVQASLSGNAGLCGPTPPLPPCTSFSFPLHHHPPAPVLVPSNPATSMPGSSSDSTTRSSAGREGGIGRVQQGLRLKRGTIIGIAVGNALLLLVLLSLLLAYCCCAGHLGEKDFIGKVQVGSDDEELELDTAEELAYGRRSSTTSPEGGINKSKKKMKGGRNSGQSTDEGEAQMSKLVFFGEDLQSDQDNVYSSDSGGSGTTTGKRRRSRIHHDTVRRRKQQFGLEELLRASAEMLGKGSLGTVYRAVLEDGSMVAVKRLKDSNPCPRKDFHKYMDLIGSLNHPNVVPLRAYYYAKQEKLLIYDYLPNATLHTLLHGNRGPGRVPLDWTTRVSLVLGAARGLSHIHAEHSSSKIPHGNIKSSNVLLDKNGAACIADFGLALLLNPAHAVARLGGYMAPEQQTDGKRILTQEADAYAFGVLLLEVLTGKAPGQYSPPTQKKNKNTNPGGGLAASINLPEWVRSVVREEWTAEVFDAELMRYKNIEDEMVAMLQVGLACVTQQPDRRPTMQEVVKMIKDIRVEQSPLPEEDLDDSRISLSPSLPATNTEDGRPSY